MKIGILGSGDVGRRLGDGFIELGNAVKIGTSNPNKGEVIQWINKHGLEKDKSFAGSFTEAANYGEIIVVATLWNGTVNAIKIADPNNFDDKIVIDVTNPLVFSDGIPPKLALGFSDSAGETIQRLIPQAKVVKAFNIVGNLHFLHPQFSNGGTPTMFICGNDNEVKKNGNR